MRDKRSILGIIGALACLLAAAFATAVPAQADSVGAQVTYQGCGGGYVCLYPNASWNNGVPEHTYYTYGAHNLVNEFGVHRVFDNQTGGATVRFCTGYNGTGCGAPMGPWTYRDIDLTPINSLLLEP